MSVSSIPERELHEEEKTCFLCDEGPREDDPLLSKACACVNAARHESCLTKWRVYSANENNFYRCEVCLTDYVLETSAETLSLMRKERKHFVRCVLTQFLGQLIGTLVLTFLVSILCRHCDQDRVLLELLGDTTKQNYFLYVVWGAFAVAVFWYGILLSRECEKRNPKQPGPGVFASFRRYNRRRRRAFWRRRWLFGSYYDDDFSSYYFPHCSRWCEPRHDPFFSLLSSFSSSSPSSSSSKSCKSQKKEHKPDKKGTENRVSIILVCIILFVCGACIHSLYLFYCEFAEMLKAHQAVLKNFEALDQKTVKEQPTLRT